MPRTAIPWKKVRNLQDYWFEVRKLRFENDVASFLLRTGAPDAVALLDEHRAWSYGDLGNLVSSVASYLARLSPAKGERALLLGDNSFFWVASYLGIMRGGLVCVPLPPNTSPDELRAITALTTPKFAFVEGRYMARHVGVVGALRVVSDRRTEHPTAVALDTEVAHSAVQLPDIAPDDLAALMFTSGSTGTPCGVMVSHRNIIANTTSIIECLRLTSRDRVLAVLPFHYCFGTSLLHTHLRAGASLVLESRFMYPEVILNRLAESECTGFAGVPSHFQILLRNSTLASRTFPRLRYVQQAGGFLSPALIDELRRALPGTEVFIMYGQTEATARLSYLAPEYLDSKRGSVGKGIPGVRLRVMAQDGTDVHPGEIGEITAVGDNIALGYWNAPEESRAHFRDGRLYTGDLATVDDEGFIYIVGREKDFLKCRGERISCQKIESQLLEFSELREVAVVGIPDDILGEGVKAFVVPRDSRLEGVADRLLKFCRQHLPPHLVPRKIVVVPDLPKNNVGKILKRALRG